MKINDLVFALVTDDHEEGTVVERHIVADERGNARIQLLPHGGSGLEVPRSGLVVGE